MKFVCPYNVSMFSPKYDHIFILASFDILAKHFKSGKSNKPLTQSVCAKKFIHQALIVYTV